MKNISEASQERTTTGGGFQRLLDTEEAAKLLRIHPTTLRRMARNGEIPALQIGKLWRFAISALLQWQQQKLAR